MGRIGSAGKLLREFTRFARANRAYWIVPFVIMLAITGIVIVAGQTAAPLIYALF